MDIRYPARIEPEDGGYLVQFVDLEEAHTEGDTLEEAVFHASEVLTLTLEARIEENLDVPPPSQRVKGAVYIAPDAKTQAAMLVRLARGGRSLAELARALETSWPSVQRLEDPTHWPSLRTLDRVAGALGKRLVLTLE